MNFVLAALGAGCGAMARYGFTNLIKNWRKTTIPLATLLINWIGAFMLALIFGVAVPDAWYQFLGVGILGGFTTFSTLNSELSGLLYERKFGPFGQYLLLTYGVGLILSGLGFWLGLKLA